MINYLFTFVDKMEVVMKYLYHHLIEANFFFCRENNIIFAIFL